MTHYVALFFARRLLGQFHLGGFEVLLYLGYLLGIDFGGDGLVPLFQRALPVRGGELEAAGFLVQVAEVGLNGWVAANLLRSTPQIIFCQIVITHPVIDPAQRVQIGAILRVERDRAANVGQCVLQAGAAVSQHVAEIVQGLRVLGIAGNDFAERLLRQLVFLLALVDGAGDKDRIILVFLLGGQLQGLVDTGFRVGPVFDPAIHLGQRDIHLAVVGGALEHRLHLINGRAHFSHVSALRRRHDLQRAIAGELLRRFLGSGGRELPLLLIAVGFDDLLVTANRVVVAEVGHAAEGVNRQLRLVGFAVDGAQPLQEDGAIVLVGGVVFTVRVLGLLQQLVEQGDGVVVLALRFVDHRDVVLHLERVGDNGAGLLESVARFVILSVAAIDLSHAHVGLRIRRVGVNDDLELRQSGIGLSVIQQVLGEAADRVQIIMVQVNGFLIRLNGLLVSLVLLVGVAQRGINLRRAGGLRKGIQHIEGPRGIAFLVVQNRQRRDRLFGVGLDLHCGLKFAFGLHQVVV